MRAHQKLAPPPASPARTGDEQRFRVLVESVKDYAIFMLDPEGRVETWNAGAELIKGYRREEIVGRRLSVFYTPEDVALGLPDRLLREAAARGRIEDEGWRVRKDGTRFWADVVITALRDDAGALLGFAKVTRDLTQRREADRARARAEEAVRLRDEFLSMASHELRTPLTTLQIELHGLNDQRTTGDDRMLKRIERSVRSADRLESVIESLMDVSRIVTGGLVLKPEPVELSHLITRVLDGLRPAAVRAGCELTFHGSGPVAGQWDRPRLEQVLLNLLSNALKYGAGGPVTVSLTADGAHAVIEVSDKGPGIREEDLNRIFQRFERAAPARHYGGLGLGLYVSREIVQAQGGTIWARNLPDGGACFAVRLPLVPAREDVPTAEE